MKYFNNFIVIVFLAFFYLDLVRPQSKECDSKENRNSMNQTLYSKAFAFYRDNVKFSTMVFNPAPKYGVHSLSELVQDLDGVFQEIVHSSFKEKLIKMLKKCQEDVGGFMDDHKSFNNVKCKVENNEVIKACKQKMFEIVEKTWNSGIEETKHYNMYAKSGPIKPYIQATIYVVKV